MNVGELFVSLGIKGTDKTVGAISNVKKGLQETASVSLEAKAAIIGAMYALERLFSKSGAVGTGLTNFNAVLGGKTTQTLQNYEYAARQVGLSNEETERTFVSLQQAMAKIQTGQGAPAGFAQLAMMTGNISTQDVDRFMKNPELLLQRLQDYAQKEKRIGVRNEVLRSFVGENMIAALARNAFTKESLSRAPTYSDKEIAQLDKANIAWSNLSTKIEMAIGHFNARHGVDLAKDFTTLVNAALRFSEILFSIGEKLHVFDFLNYSFKLAGDSAKWLGDQVSDLLKEIEKPVGKKDSGIVAFLKQMYVSAKETYKKIKIFFDQNNFEQIEAKFIKFANSGGAVTDIVKTFQNLRDIISDTVDILEVLIKDTKGIGEIFNMIPKGWSLLTDSIKNQLDAVSKGLKDPKEALKLKEDTKNTLIDLLNFALLPEPSADNKEKAPSGGIGSDILNFLLKAITPSVQPAPVEKTQNFNINQNLHFDQNQSKDAHSIGRELKKQIDHVLRTSSAQIQGS